MRYTRWLAILCSCWCLWMVPLGCPAPPQEPTSEPIADEPASSDGTKEPGADATETTPEPREAPPEASTDEAPPEPRAEQPPETPGESGPVATFADVCRLLAEGACRPVYSCCKDWKPIYADLATCVNEITQQCLAGGKEKQAKALADGHALIAQDKVTACRKLFADAHAQCTLADGAAAALSCGMIIQDKAAVGEDCKSALGGLACAGGAGVCFPTPVGTPCKAWSQDGTLCKEAPCIPGTYCILQPDPSDPAVCKAPQIEGAPCSVHRHCKAGLACLGGKCSTPQALGDACASTGQCAAGAGCDTSARKCVAQVQSGTTCNFADHCADGLHCHGLLAGLTCQPKLTQGTTCQRTSDCLDALSCQSGTCQPRPGEGKACSRDLPCNSGLVCDADVCKKIPASGEPCLSGQTPCAEGLACFGGTCKPKATQGNACTDDTQCARDLGCVNQACAPLPQAGSACHNDIFCHSSAYCDFPNKTCVTRRTEGQNCPMGYECDLALSCVTDGAQSKICVATPGRGERCSTACTTGLTCKPGNSPGKCAPAICKGALE